MHDTSRRWDFYVRATAPFAGLACLLLVVGLLTGVACDAQTAGKQIVFSAAVAGATSEGTPISEGFTTFEGWSVQMERAALLVGPIYFYDGQVYQAGLFRRLFMGAAHACPAHAQHNAGALLGEIIEQYAVDLMASPQEFEPIMGFEGICRAIELHIHPPGRVDLASTSPDTTILEGHSVLLEGIASKGESEVPFIARMTIPDTGLMRIVESIGVDSIILDEEVVQGGLLQVNAQVDMWLAAVDFYSLTEQEGDRFVFTEDTQAWTALLRGLRSRYAYEANWSTR